MQATEFIHLVKERAHLPDVDAALNASRATLETLSERLKGREPIHLASQLPPEIGQYLRGPHSGAGERFAPDLFFRRVSEREGVDVQTARDHAQAVMAVVNEAISPGEIADMLSQLPPEYRQLLGPSA